MGEQIARDYLIRQGYVIRETNWRLNHLEIDIVAQEPNVNLLHIVEVKTRSEDVHFDPLKSITRTKIRNLINAANGYLSYYHLRMGIQYDVVLVIGSPQDYKVTHILNAFRPPLKTYR